jgi:hypothetical protein
MKMAWPSFSALHVENRELNRRFQSLCQIEVQGNTTAFASSLLRHHGIVAEGKGGTSWVALEGTKVHALNADYAPWEWQRMEETAWANNYYIEPLRSVLRGLDHGVAS